MAADILNACFGDWPETYEAAACLSFEHAFQRLEMLADAGITVSVCYGPCGSSGKLWSVDMTSPSYSLPKPIGAESFQQAIWVADREARELGWLAERA